MIDDGTDVDTGETKHDSRRGLGVSFDFVSSVNANFYEHDVAPLEAASRSRSRGATLRHTPTATLTGQVRAGVEARRLAGHVEPGTPEHLSSPVKEPIAAIAKPILKPQHEARVRHIETFTAAPTVVIRLADEDIGNRYAFHFDLNFHSGAERYGD